MTFRTNVLDYVFVGDTHSLGISRLGDSRGSGLGVLGESRRTVSVFGEAVLVSVTTVLVAADRPPNLMFSLMGATGPPVGALLGTSYTRNNDLSASIGQTQNETFTHSVYTSTVSISFLTSINSL